MNEETISKQTQIEIMKFFLKTSIPKMLNDNRK